MKFREYEAKQIFRDAGIPTPNSELITDAKEAAAALSRVAEKVVLKAQVDVGGRGKAGGILPATAETVDATAVELFGKQIKGLPVEKVLVEEALEILKANGEDAYVIGEIIEAEDKIILE